jgi:ABC-type polysaccharide/polyol phosphate export permease
MQLWHYVTPVIFPLSKLLQSAAAAAALYRLPESDDPVVEMYKWGVLGIGRGCAGDSPVVA